MCTSPEDSSGPHTRMVVSSETETSMLGSTGFHATQFTVREWPCSTAMGSSFFVCHTYTLLSVGRKHDYISSIQCIFCGPAYFTEIYFVITISTQMTEMTQNRHLFWCTHSLFMNCTNRNAHFMTMNMAP